MRCSGRALLTLVFAGVAAYAVLSARDWQLKAALFPMVTGIPLFLLAVAQFFLDLRGKPEVANGPAIDLELSADVPPEVAHRRIITIFSWIAGFILLVLLLGFPLAVPLFMLSYLALQSRAGWWLSLILTAAAWGFFYGLFQRVLRIPYEDGLIQTWLGL